GACVSGGVAWTVYRLIPAAVRRTTEAGEVAATALEDFLHAGATVLRTPTLIRVFIGGALVTFAANGLIAWAATFMARVHGFTVAQAGREFGLWGITGGVLGALAGGRLAARQQQRWRGGGGRTSRLGSRGGG